MSVTVVFASGVASILVWFFVGLRYLKRFQRDSLGISPNTRVVAFFHPFCDAGGGGERVLWTAIQSLTVLRSSMIILYAADTVPAKEALIARVKDQFGIAIDPSFLMILKLKSWRFLDSKRYPFMTLLAQSLGSLVPCLESLLFIIPDVYIDTMGAPFIYPIARWIYGTQVVAYVHYPVISTDMLERVSSRQEDYNNSSFVAKSRLLSFGKWMYYVAFTILYAFAGWSVNVIMVNSSWTKGHIARIWRAHNVHLVFPPCNTHRLTSIPLQPRNPWILSLAQFRPEKAHSLQVDILATLFAKYPEHKGSVKMFIIGGVRNAADQALVDHLKSKAAQASLSSHIEIIPNASVEVLSSYFSHARVGIHTMRNEHFGIGIVEYMAAGLVPLAHGTGGPLMDIVAPFEGESTGFLAETPDNYADMLHRILTMSQKDSLAMQRTARNSVLDRFSDTTFQRAFLALVQTLL